MTVTAGPATSSTANPVWLDDCTGNGRTQVMFNFHDANFIPTRVYGPNGPAYDSNGLWPGPLDAAMLPCEAVGAQALGKDYTRSRPGRPRAVGTHHRRKG